MVLHGIFEDNNIPALSIQSHESEIVDGTWNGFVEMHFPLAKPKTL